MFGPPLLAMREHGKRIDPGLCLQDDTATSATITTIGPAAGNVLLAAKTGDAVAAVASHYFDLNTVNKHAVASSARHEDGSARYLVNVHPAAFAVKPDNAIRKGEEGVVISHANIHAWMETGANLPHQNVASTNCLPAKTFHAASLGVGITAVSARTLTFFMCHR
jgi:hypothetical protein